MSLLRKMLAAGFAASVALVGPLATAHAAPIVITAPVQLPVDVAPTPSESAAAQVIAQLKTETVGTSLGSNPGNTADAVLLLDSAGKATEVADLVAWLESREAAITEPVQAAKVAYALHLGGGDAAVIDALLAKSLAGMKEDGSVGWPSAFTQSWPIIALAATGKQVPQEMLDNLFTHQGTTSAMFGYVPWGQSEWAPEFDATGMALWALVEVRASQCELDLTRVDAEYPRLLAAIADAQTDEGYWTSASPVNSTGVLAAALQRAGVDTSAAVQWLASKQLPDGGMPATLAGTSSNTMATLQGAVPLGTVDVVPAGCAVEEEPTGEDETPGGDGQTPSEDDETPGGDGRTPSGDDETPSGDDPTDGTGEGAPTTGRPATAKPAGKPTGLPATGSHR